MSSIVRETLNTDPVYYDHLKKSAEITVYPRIHMFSLNLSLQNNGLPCGSLGVSIAENPIHITAKKNTITDVLSSNYVGDSTFVNTLEKLRTYKQLTGGWSVTVQIPDTIRPHIGLGTTTQILGGAALCSAKASGVDLTNIDLFKMGFGRASNLGLSLLYKPGFIFEYGYRVDFQNGLGIHPNISTYPELPSNRADSIKDCPWHLLYGVPKKLQSLSGDIEESFWENNLPEDPISAKITENAVKNYIIPGLLANNFQQFISGMSRATDHGSKLAEEHIQEPATLKVLSALRKKLGFAAVSSLGPTVYAFQERLNTKELSKLGTDEYDFFSTPLNQLNRINNG